MTAFIRTTLFTLKKNVQAARTGHRNCGREGYTFFLWAILLFIFLVAELLVQEWTENRRFRENRRRSVVEQLSTIRAKLEGELHAELLLARSIITEVETKADISRERFFSLAEHFMAAAQHIRNIGIAKGTVLTDVYPIQGNEAAVGLDYRKNPLQWPAVQRVIREGKTVVAGPLQLVQGGIGIIGRTPIYTETSLSGDRNQNKEYYGLLSVVIDVPGLFSAAGLDSKNSIARELNIALRGKDGLGAEGAVFYGTEAVYRKEPVLLDITLPGGKWQMAAVPVGGWDKHSPNILTHRIATLLVGLILLFLLIQQHREIKNRKAVESERNRLIRELEIKNRTLREQALTDPLTGLCNRRALLSALENEVSRNRRFGHTSCLLLADIDHFKRINDTYGHEAGDLALKKIASCIGGILRRTDIFARWGGEEFLLLAPETALDHAVILAERVRSCIENMSCADGFRITVSIGIAEFIADEENVDCWISRADKALYRAKSCGRNRVESDSSSSVRNRRVTLIPAT